MRGGGASNPAIEDPDVLEAAQCFGVKPEPSDTPQTEETSYAAWPEHMQALSLFLACLGQLEIQMGGMGGVLYDTVRAVNVQQELLWLGIPPEEQATTVRLYRVMEREAVQCLAQEAQKAR